MPLATSAVTQAEGPGITSTSTPASRAASTRTCPGSETLGMPASEANAITSPAKMRPISSGERDAITFSSHRINGREIPKWASSFDVTRVSSQQIASAASKACATRGVRSPRFPMGVPTIMRRPEVLLHAAIVSNRPNRRVEARTQGMKANRASRAQGFPAQGARPRRRCASPSSTSGRTSPPLGRKKQAGLPRKRARTRSVLRA